VQRHDSGPSAFAWLVAFVSVALPWIGVGLGITGGWKLSCGEAEGWVWLCGGVAAIVADTLIDFVPTTQLFGSIHRGRGKVRVGDTLWPVEGPDVPVGTCVKVTGARGNLLVVDRP
jgi:hypothetical protein